MTKQKQYVCGLCGKHCGKLDGIKQHARSVHGGKLVKIYEHCTTLDMRPDEEPSIAMRMVQAEIDIACGKRTDDVWLLP